MREMRKYELTDERLSELRQIAEAAAEGPWAYVEDDRRDEVRVFRAGALPTPVAWTGGVGEGNAAVDAAHIAAFDPPTVLALLDEMRRLQIQAAESEHARKLAFESKDRARRELARWRGMAENEAEVERLREPGRIADAIAAVTPCSCSAQRARAEAAEAKLAAVRALHQPLDAINVDAPPGRQRTRVCAVCAGRNGPWAVWPCVTIQAIEGET